MKKSLFFCALASIALASCSNDSETAAGSDSTIQLKASLQQVNVLTRAPFLNDPSLNNPLTADILIANASTDFTAATLYNTATGIAAEFTSSTGPGLTTPCMWPANAATNLYFVGLAPAGAWGTSTATQTVATANGAKDLMTTGAPTAASKSSGSVPLTFAHSQVFVKLYVRAENAAAAGDWGSIRIASNIKSMNFTGQLPANDVDIPEVMTLNLQTGAVTATSSAVGTFTFRQIDATGVQEIYTGDLASELTTIPFDREAAFGYVMLPLSSTQTLKSLIVELVSSNALVGAREARINMGAAAPGSAYSVHLTLKENGRISFDAVNVTEWGVVTNATGTIGG